MIVAMLALVARAGATILVSNAFNSASCPAGWATEGVATNASGNPPAITFVNSSANPTPPLYDGSYFVKFNSFDCKAGSQARLKQTASFSTVGYASVINDFAWFQDATSTYSGSSYTNEGVTVQWSTNGIFWTNGNSFQRIYSVSGWRRMQYYLPSAALNQPAVYIAFLFNSQYGNNCYLDDVQVIGVTPATNSISGTVTNGSGGLAGVIVTSSPSGSAATTDTNGNYSITNLASGTYSITPFTINYTFSPTSYGSITVGTTNATGKNFAATPIYSISGTVTNGSGGLAGVMVTSSPSGSAATTDASGNYTITNLVAGTYTITPSKASYTFTPANLSNITVGPSTTSKNFSGWRPSYVLYVWTNSPSSTPPYTNWATAAQTIQAAVNYAQAGDIVLVTNGSYNSGGKVVYGAIFNRVAIDKAITVQSVGNGATSIVGSGAGGGTNNGDGAIRCVYVSANAILSGFTLINGHTLTNGDSLTEQCGGGVWCEVGGIVTNCTLTGNSARYYGGGSCGGTLNNCSLTGNSASLYGGGSYSGTLNNCFLLGNSAYIGGGSYADTLNNCTLTGNSARGDGGGAFSCQLFNCILSSNSADKTNGAGGGAYNCTLNNCTVTRNSANMGGGSYGGTLNNCTLSNNLVTGYSGSSYGGGSCDGTLNNCTLTGNSANTGSSYAALGGGSYGCTLNNCTLTGNYASWGGGSYYGMLTNCTLTGNSASIGGGSHYDTLNNCIVYYNTALGSSNFYSSTFSYSCTTPLPSGAGNIISEPMFVNRLAGNLRLLVGSPCIDAGNDAVVQPGWLDVDGNPRIAYARVDMGAYEFVDTALPAFTGLTWVTNQVSREGSLGVSVLLTPNYNLPSFQWYLNGSTLLPDQTSPTLVLNSVKLGDAGVYSLVVSNRNGSVTGTVLTLIVTYQIANLGWTPANSNFSLSLPTELGRAYWLEARDGLVGGLWQVIAGLTNREGLNCLMDTNALGTRRFYRIGSSLWP
ncbi:MAG: carboxypeptidase regulatory-like domain-containing protein [Verrucomicrobiota bacterium]